MVHRYLLTIQRIRKNGINLAVSKMIIASRVRPLSVKCQRLKLGSADGEELTVQA